MEKNPTFTKKFHSLVKVDQQNRENWFKIQLFARRAIKISELLPEFANVDQRFSGFRSLAGLRFFLDNGNNCFIIAQCVLPHHDKIVDTDSFVVAVGVCSQVQGNVDITFEGCSC